MSTRSATGPSTKASALGEDPLKSRLDRLKNLQLRKNEARKLNHEELVEEDRRSSLPSNHEARKRRAEWQVEVKNGAKFSFRIIFLSTILIEHEGG